MGGLGVKKTSEKLPNSETGMQNDLTFEAKQ